MIFPRHRTCCLRRVCRDASCEERLSNNKVEVFMPRRQVLFFIKRCCCTRKLLVLRAAVHLSYGKNHQTDATPYESRLGEEVVE